MFVKEKEKKSFLHMRTSIWKRKLRVASKSHTLAFYGEEGGVGRLKKPNVTRLVFSFLLSTLSTMVAPAEINTHCELSYASVTCTLRVVLCTCVLALIRASTHVPAKIENR